MKKNRKIGTNEEFMPPICLITESYCDIFEKMYEGASIYEVIRDNEGKITNLKIMYFNPRSILNEITSLKEAVGKTLEELFSKEIEIPYLEIADRVISTGKGVTFETFFEPNGKYFLVSAFSPNPDLYITLSLDITENKRYQLALKESVENFKTLVENSPNVVTRFDRKLRHTFINPAGAQMTGLSPEDYIGKTHHELGLPKEIANQVTDLLKRIFKTGKPETFEFEIPAPEGTKYYISNNIPEFDENGRVKSILAIAHDITTIKKTEKELRSSEQKFRKTIEESYDGIMLIDEKRKIIEWNKAMEEITGLKREDMIGSFLWDFMYKILASDDKTPEMYKRIKSALLKNLNEYLAFQPNRRIEREIQHPDGGHRFIESTVYPIKTEKGVMYGSITRDVTENKRLEQELKEREERYRTIFENTGNPTMIIEKDKTISMVNEEFEKVTGYSKEEIEGTKWTEIVLKEDLEHMKQYHNLRRVDPSKAPKNYEAHMINKNGDVRTINLTVGLIQDEDKSVASFIDITEIKKDEKELENYRNHLEELVKKRAEELENAYNALSESEEKFRELFNNATDMISLNEVKENCMPGNFIEVNEVASVRLGYSKEELLNMSPINIVAPENRDEMPENAAKLCKAGDATFEIVHVTKDGKRIPVEVTHHLFKLRDKTVALAISRDITERKNAEIERNQFIEELKRSNDELQQFAYISSHDLQEPLRTIASFTQLLERRYKGQLDPDADEFIEYIVDATKRMQNLIKDLLEYSRITTRSGEFKLVSMEKVVKSVLNNLRTIITENSAEITYDPLPEAVADENQIIRVFQNLITNSIKFKKPDEPPKIHISATKDEEMNEYVFSVSDNGIGIEKQYFDRIFTIFQRLHTRDEYKGTGIGLAVVKRIIERHGGRIWVNSEPGRCSTFYFTIPTNLEPLLD